MFVYTTIDIIRPHQTFGALSLLLAKSKFRYFAARVMVSGNKCGLEKFSYIKNRFTGFWEKYIFCVFLCVFEVLLDFKSNPPDVMSYQFDPEDKSADHLAVSYANWQGVVSDIKRILPEAVEINLMMENRGGYWVEVVELRIKGKTGRFPLYMRLGKFKNRLEHLLVDTGFYVHTVAQNILTANIRNDRERDEAMDDFWRVRLHSVKFSTSLHSGFEPEMPELRSDDSSDEQHDLRAELQERLADYVEEVRIVREDEEELSYEDRCLEIAQIVAESGTNRLT